MTQADYVEFKRRHAFRLRLSEALTALGLERTSEEVTAQDRILVVYHKTIGVSTLWIKHDGVEPYSDPALQNARAACAAWLNKHGAEVGR